MEIAFSLHYPVAHLATEWSNDPLSQFTTKYFRPHSVYNVRSVRKVAFFLFVHLFFPCLILGVNDMVKAKLQQLQHIKILIINFLNPMEISSSSLLL